MCEVRGQLHGLGSLSTFTWAPWFELKSQAYVASFLTPQVTLLA